MQQAEHVLYPKGGCNDIFVDLCRRDAEREAYIESGVSQQITDLLSQNLRVCLLVPKDAVPCDLDRLCTENNSPLIPCLG